MVIDRIYSSIHAPTPWATGNVPPVREWPFDVSVAARLAVYLVIPLVSWAGAALVERAVNAFLG